MSLPSQFYRILDAKNRFQKSNIDEMMWKIQLDSLLYSGLFTVYFKYNNNEEHLYSTLYAQSALSKYEEKW